MIPRQETVTVAVGGVRVGSDAPIDGAIHDQY